MFSSYGHFKLFITDLSATSKTLMKITLSLTHIHSALDFGRDESLFKNANAQRVSRGGELRTGD